MTAEKQSGANFYKPFIVANDALGDGARLRALLAEHGYLYLKQFAPKDKILVLRQKIVGFFQEAGWLKEGTDLMAGIWSGVGPFVERDPPFMNVYRYIQQLQELIDLPHDEAIMSLLGDILQGPVFNHDLHISRISFPKNVSQATCVHQDFHYIRGTPETYTNWIPLSDCPIELGPVALLHKSHTVGLIEHKQIPGKKFASAGLDNQALPQGAKNEWHCNDFELGDMLLFHSHLIHKALPNVTEDRFRLSVDNRYQLATEETATISFGTHYEDYFKYHKWRRKSLAFLGKDLSQEPYLIDYESGIVPIEQLQNRDPQRDVEHFSYDFLFRQITAGDMGDATEYLVNFINRTQSESERQAFISDLEKTIEQRSPLGEIPSGDRQQFLDSLKKDDQQEAQSIDREWKQQCQTICQRALKSPRHE